MDIELMEQCLQEFVDKMHDVMGTHAQQDEHQTEPEAEIEEVKEPSMDGDEEVKEPALATADATADAPAKNQDVLDYLKKIRGEPDKPLRAGAITMIGGMPAAKPKFQARRRG